MISLQNKKILVTREKRGAEKFAELITAFEGVPVQTPLLQINCVSFSEQIKHNLESGTYKWIFFTSKSGVDCFFSQSAFITNCRIAAVGPKTAQAIEAYGYNVEFIPSVYNAKTMAQEFLEMYEDFGTALLVRGNLSSHVLLEAFTDANLNYECVVVYETVPNQTEKQQLQHILQTEQIDYLTFTSPSTIDAFIELTKEDKIKCDSVVVCIGTTTEKKAKEVGFSHIITPEYFTIEGMVEVIDKHLQGKKVRDK